MNYEITPDDFRNVPRPAISDRWQKEFTRIVGKNEYGMPQVRLVWGCDETRIAFGKIRKKYLAAVLKEMTCWQEKRTDGTVINHPPGNTPPSNIQQTSLVYPVYETTDIGKRRWILEEHWPAEIVAKDWEENRYAWIDGIRTDVLGPVPTEGQYRFLHTIETEDGKYREPSERDLDFVRQLLQLRDQEKKKYGNREAQHSTDDIAKLAAQYEEVIETERREGLDKLEESLREHIRPHIDKLVKNPEAAWG